MNCKFTPFPLPRVRVGTADTAKAGFCRNKSEKWQISEKASLWLVCALAIDHIFFLKCSTAKLTNRYHHRQEAGWNNKLTWASLQEGKVHKRVDFADRQKFKELWNAVTVFQQMQESTEHFINNHLITAQQAHWSLSAAAKYASGGRLYPCVCTTPEYLFLPISNTCFFCILLGNSKAVTFRFQGSQFFSSIPRIIILLCSSCCSQHSNGLQLHST